jgi:hypothetical protein
MNPPTSTNPGGLATNEPRPRYYTPGEFSAALEACGISIRTDAVRERCALPEGDALHIRTNNYFPGRRYIPESELFRLLNLKDLS